MSAHAITVPFLDHQKLTTTTGWIAARKLSPAPTAALAASIDAQGLPAWVDAQLSPHTLPENPHYNQERQALFPSMFNPRDARRTRDRIFWDKYQKVKAKNYDITIYTIEAAMHRAWASTKHLQNTMALFWADTFAVSIEKSPVSYHDYIGDLHDHALGSYKDLLWAMVNNRAVIHFLDNHTSTRYALNENMGREIMELYSWGPEKGYTHKDVLAAARLLSGFRGDIDTYGDGAQPHLHQFGPQTIMGRTIKNGGSTAAHMYATLREFTNYLATDRHTALRIARRLITHFIGTTLPTDHLAQALADTYLKNDTRIGPVLRQLILSPEFTASAGHTITRPWTVFFSLMATANLRLKGTADYSTAHSCYQPLYKMWWNLYDRAGGVPYSAPATNGYPLDPQSWLNSANYAALSTFSRFTHYIDTWDGNDPSRFTRWSQPINWSTALNIPLGSPLGKAATTLFTTLTGYQPDPHITEALALYAAHRTPHAISKGKLSQVAHHGVTEEHLHRMIQATLTTPHLLIS